MLEQIVFEHTFEKSVLHMHLDHNETFILVFNDGTFTIIPKDQSTSMTILDLLPQDVIRLGIATKEELDKLKKESSK